LRTALLLVDLQNDYLDAPGLQPARGEIVRAAEALLRRARDEGLPVIHVLTTIDPEHDNRMPHWRSAGRWICVRGTAGHEPPEPLRALENEPVVHKQSFSGFESGALESLLRQSKVEAVTLAGVHLHACIRQTALDAYARGYRVTIAGAATGSNDPIHAEVTRRYLADRGIRLMEEEARGADIEAALAALESGLESWRGEAMEARTAVLQRWARALDSERETLARTITAAIGKPIADSVAEVERTVELIDAVCRFAGTPAEWQAGSASRARLRPHGVVGVITPWNNPLAIPAGKIAPAITWGNAVLWKPSPLADALTAPLLESLEAAGAPVGLITAINGGSTVSRRLLEHPRVAAATITGSPGAGAAALEICTRRGIPLQAELGGNNAAVVWKDADLSSAASEIAEGAFGFAGQRCTANRRIIVHREVHAQFVARFVTAAGGMVLGDPFEASTRIGPLVTTDAARRVLEEIARARGRGCRITEAHRQVPSARHLPAMIVEDARPEDPIVQDETFGPVAVVQIANDWPKALALCNGVRQGLAAALFSRDRRLWEDFQQRAEAGILKWNASTAGADAVAPFGGWKSSGVGPPEHGAFDVQFYTRPQAIYGG
jgi:alpha-ketoglutaric semialdehyde dehydrogenase